MNWIEFNGRILCPETGAYFFSMASEFAIRFFFQDDFYFTEGFKSEEERDARWEKLKQKLLSRPQLPPSVHSELDAIHCAMKEPEKRHYQEKRYSYGDQQYYKNKQLDEAEKLLRENQK